ncbi:3-dehydrosphinganine reductase [Chytriomyces hyalinus]|nr:3-dehydrosphinganine reductase [Chytriomyces hyalinus]
MEIGAALAILAVCLILVLPLAGLMKVILSFFAAMQISKQSLQKMRGKHVLVTGASRGLGREIALYLAENGVKVTLCSRGGADLQLTADECKQKADVGLGVGSASTGGGSSVAMVAADLTSFPAAVDAMRSVYNELGRPDWVICNAGKTYPGFLGDQLGLNAQNVMEMEAQMDVNYYTALNTIRACMLVAKETSHAHADSNVESGHTDSSTAALTRDDSIVGFTAAEARNLASKFICIGSPLAYVSFVGFAGYSSSKYALRGLCDVLRNELLPLGISMHLFSPGSMNTPGFAEENKTKPEITCKIEGTDVAAEPDFVARALVGTVLNGRYAGTHDLLSELIRVAANGCGPRPNPVSELLCVGLLSTILEVVFYMNEIQILRHFKKGGWKRSV